MLLAAPTRRAGGPRHGAGGPRHRAQPGCQGCPAQHRHRDGARHRCLGKALPGLGTPGPPRADGDASELRAPPRPPPPHREGTAWRRLPAGPAQPGHPRAPLPGTKHLCLPSPHSPPAPCRVSPPSHRPLPAHSSLGVARKGTSHQGTSHHPPAATAWLCAPRHAVHPGTPGTSSLQDFPGRGRSLTLSVAGRG